MRQVRISSVAGNVLTTTEGQVLYAAGNRNFSPGDIVWTDGRVVFGHESAGGGSFVPTVAGVIPVLFFVDGQYHYGVIDRGVYQNKAVFDSALLYRSIFANDQTNAFFILAEGDDHDNSYWLKNNTAYNLLTKATVFTNIQGIVLNAAVSAEGDLLTVIWKRDFRAGHGLVHTGAAPTSIARTELKFYKNAEVTQDLALVIDALFTQIKTLIENKYVNVYLYEVYINTRNVTVQASGSCSLLVAVTVPVFVQDENNLIVLDAVDYIFYKINVASDGSYSIDRLDDKLGVPLNDPYAYSGVSTYPNSDPVEIANSDGEQIATVNPLNLIYGAANQSGATFDIVCVQKIEKGYLVHCRASWNWMEYILNQGAAGPLKNPSDMESWDNYISDNNTILLVTPGGQTILIELEYGFNARFARMPPGKIRTIQANLQQILGGV